MAAKIMTKQAIKLGIIFLISFFLWDNARSDDASKLMKKFKLECTDCHTCEKPSTKTPCLKPCPRLFTAQVTGAHGSMEAPDMMLLGKISEQYEPVRFKHKLHAEMSEMGQGCSICHHFCPPGRIPPCEACHGGQANPTNLRQPSLKGAYHRQCLSCHREWAHDTNCSVCHLEVSDSLLNATIHDKTDIMGTSHPLLTPPEKKTYVTPYPQGAIVTFYHKEHIELFGLRCVDCHQKENCGYCHDLQKPAASAKTMEQVHAICSGCHAQNQCDKCHDTKERPAFSHASTGWSIGRFHSRLDCRACHPTGKRISKVNKDCTNCHAGWSRETFRHAVTGLQLDETHIELDCESCHIDKKFEKTPDCASCHDDNRSPKKTPPGQYIKIGKS
jgi:hypothetical protein